MGAPRLLVVGGSGPLGAAVQRLRTGTCLRTYCSRPSAGAVQFDLRAESPDSLLTRVGGAPQSAILMAGVTSIDACATDPVGTAELNVHALTRLADALIARRTAVVFVSSDGVFDGTRSWWSEADLPVPVLEYGRQKLAVEAHIAARGGLVVRLPKLLESVLPGWWHALRGADPILCASDQHFTPVGASEAAAAMLALADAGQTGVWHVGGPERLSRRELLDVVAREVRRGGTSPAPIQSCLLADVPVLEARPRDTSLDSTKLANFLGRELRAATDLAAELTQAAIQGKP